MKVIDLLNKMANGEEVPKKIKFENNIYEYNKERQDYIHKINDFRSETLLFNVMSTYYIEELLEANVELIEDEVDIDNIEESEAFYKEIENLNDAKLEIDNLRISHNELVQAVKQLNKEIKELNKKYCCNCGVELTEENTALPNMCNECKYGEEWEQC